MEKCRNMKVQLPCRICGNLGMAYFPSHIKRGNGKFCSSQCFYVSLIGRNVSKETRVKLSVSQKEHYKKHPERISNYWLGKKRSQETKDKLSKFFTGKSFITERGRKIISEKISLRRRGQTILKQSGKYHYKWKGGITPINEKIRRSVEYKEWRWGIFLRDDFTCQKCSIRGGKLHADHIKPFAYFPELRFDLKNGRTLCESCHRGTETWGGNAVRLYESGYNELSTLHRKI